MSDNFEVWLEAAYLYYIRPDLEPTMFDAQWDMLARKYEQYPPQHPLMERFYSPETGWKFNTAYHLGEEEYPDWIREKYKEVQDCNQESKEASGPEETEVGVREEGSSFPRAE